MNEQLVKFIELCLIDGVLTEKEREVIFRKSKELGVPIDECEIILEGLQHKFKISKPNKIEDFNIDNSIDNKEEIIKIKKNDFVEISDEKLRTIFNRNSQKRIKEIEKSMNELEKSSLDFVKRLEIINTTIKKNQEEYQKNLNELKDLNIESYDEKLNKERKELSNYLNNGYVKIRNDYRREIESINSIYNDKNFQLFKKLYKESPLLFQSNIFNRFLETININNDEHILNLSRFLKFIIKKEKEYSKEIKTLFEKIETGNMSKTDLELLLINKSNLISFYNSFHLMYQSLVNNKMGVFMKIYIEIESMGIFTSFFEENVMNNLNILNKHLSNLNSTLSLVSKQLSLTNNYIDLLNTQMYKTNLLVEETNYNLQDISDGIEQSNSLLGTQNDYLSSINSGIGMNNLLTGIQTYQMYKINTNTKSLRG
jgi:F0F1-type ATP synthase membrane subunit b/b'